MLALPKHTDAVAVEDAMLRELPDGWAMTTLGEACLINPRFFTEPVEDDRELSFLPMAAVEAGTGRIDLSRTRLFADVRKGYTRFSEGDVLFAKITPCMENGKIALAKGLTNNCGCGSTEFHVLRPHKGISGGFLMFFLFQDAFRREAQGHMAGTAGQLRVPTGFLEEAPLPCRSALQAAIFDPTKDHTNQRMRGFPCLQQVAFAPQGADGLMVTGLYATQYIFERAYGNYLGLCRLGRFMAQEMGKQLTQVTCVASPAKGGDKTKGYLRELARGAAGIVDQLQEGT